MDWIRILSDGVRSGLGMNAAVYALAAVGLNLQYGYTGLWNFGQAGFLLVGAYGTAIAVNSWGFGLGWAVLVGVGAAVLLGLVLGLPTLRLRADYLAIVTISAAEILRIVVNSTSVQSVTGGPQGIQGFANSFFDRNPIPEGRYGIGSITFTHRDLWVISVTWAIVGLASVMVMLLVHSPWGRVVRAIREDEDAVRALGKNVFAYKMQSLVLGGALGGLAGIMLVIDRQFVEPNNFQSAITFFAYAALILGGTARILGPVLGAITFWFLIEGTQSFLTQAVTHDFLGVGHVVSPTQVGPIRFALVGLLIMVLVIFRPQGFLGSRTEVMIGD
jgi:ABC-type branched-chain amino acid transport system, permease component